MAIGMANDHLSSECEALEVARREMAQAQAALAETQKRADGLAALLEQERTTLGANFIALGHHAADVSEDVLLRLTRGESIGTLLVANTHKMQARKQWIADHLQLRGSVTVDAGAVSKLRDEGKSLLPIGMITVEGDFSRGEVIAVRDENGVEIARGLASYASAEARLLCRKSSSEIESLLGYSAGPEIMHRDNMVVAGH